MKRITVALAIAFYFYTRIDILVWQRIFETHELWDLGKMYHPGWYQALYGLMAIGAILMLPHWKNSIIYAGALYSLARFSGLEDILYYWLDGRAVPGRLPWLDECLLPVFRPVTNTTIILSALAWSLSWVGVVLAVQVGEKYFRFRQSKRTAPLPMRMDDAVPALGH